MYKGLDKKISHLSFFLFLFALLLFVWSLWKRVIHVDDAWLAEYSYFYNIYGYVKSEAMRGFLGAENKLYVYHKILAVEGAWLIHWFGFRPYVLKALSLVYLLPSLWLVHRLYLRHSLEKKNAWLLAALFLSFFHIVNLSFTFRPEMQLLCWGLLSYLLLESYSEQHKRVFLLLSAFLAGWTVAVHLNGLIYVGTGVLWLAWRRRFKDSFLYGVIGSWGLFFYFLFDAHSGAELQASWQQLRQWRDVSTADYGWSLLIRLLEEQGRFLHSPAEMVYTFYLLLLLIPARKMLWRQHKGLVVYTGILTFCLAELSHGKNTNYLLYGFPFFLVLGLSSFEELLKKERRTLAWTAVGVFLVGSWTTSLKTFYKREEMFAEYAQVAATLPESARLLGPIYYIFHKTPHQNLQNFIHLRDQVEAGLFTASPELLFEKAEEFGNSYVILDVSNENFFKVEGEAYGNYILAPEQPSPHLKIFKLRN
ncbi:MAG: hypothetical protein AAGB31_11460 [Bdellovibrio sp.]